MVILIIQKVVVGSLKTNCYILSTNKNNCLIFDPGSDFDKINSYIIKNNLIACYIVLTHGHYDHIGAVPKLKKTYPKIKVAISEEDQNCLFDGQKSLASVFGIYDQTPVKPDVIITDNMTIKIDDVDIKCILAPGHTPGGVCYLINNNFLLTGDTLFKNSIGRTDLLGGNQKQLENTIKKIYKIFETQDKEQVNIYPGHGFSSNLKQEFYSNPYLFDFLK